jgi:hypothetical protein
MNLKTYSRDQLKCTFTLLRVDADTLFHHRLDSSHTDFADHCSIVFVPRSAVGDLIPDRFEFGSIFIE